MFLLAVSGTSVFSWAEFVRMLETAMDTVYRSGLRLLRLFVTPFSEIIEDDTGITSWIIDIMGWFLDLFGIQFLDITPLELMLGTAFPTIIVFTIYRYVKQ